MQKKSIVKGPALTFIYFLALMGSLLLPVQKLFRVAVIAVLTLIFVFFRRSYIYLTKGARLVRAGKTDEAFKYLSKAVKLGIEQKNVLDIASLAVQSWDVKWGMDLLEEILESPESKETEIKAIIALATGYRLSGDKTKAVELLEKPWKDGCRSTQAAVNLTTYLLEDGKTEEAKDILDECIADDISSDGLTDNLGWYYIVKGNWDEAEKTYAGLGSEAGFPEIYVHSAQVYTQCGNIEEAVEKLELALEKPFVRICPFTREYVNGLSKGLTGDNVEDFAALMNRNAVEIASGRNYGGTGANV